MVNHPSFESVFQSLNAQGDSRTEPETKQLLRRYLHAQTERYLQRPEDGPEIALEISRLMDTAAAHELRANYLPYKALDLGGYLELPEAHRAGVTWDMLAEVIEALPESGDAPELSDQRMFDVIQDADVPFEKRRRVLNSYLRRQLAIRNQDRSQETLIAYKLAGALGTATAKEMRDDHQYYLCLDLAANLALPEAQRSIGSWDVLVRTVQTLPVEP